MGILHGSTPRTPIFVVFELGVPTCIGSKIQVMGRIHDLCMSWCLCSILFLCDSEKGGCLNIADIAMGKMMPEPRMPTSILWVQTWTPTETPSKKSPFIGQQVMAFFFGETIWILNGIVRINSLIPLINKKIGLWIFKVGKNPMSYVPHWIPPTKDIQEIWLNCRSTRLCFREQPRIFCLGEMTNKREKNTGVSSTDLLSYIFHEFTSCPKR